MSPHTSRKEETEAPSSDALLTQLADTLSRTTGLRPSRLPNWCVLRAARDRLTQVSATELFREAETENSALSQATLQGLKMADTFFYRHPDQFRYLKDEFLPTFAGSPDAPLSAWSAGCSTGEETYSIAAFLLGELGIGRKLSILGTDIVRSRVEHAREGLYDPMMVSGIDLVDHPLFEDAHDERLKVRPELRAITRFHCHNLVQAAPLLGAPFQLIFCRNVLLYLSDEAAARVYANLAAVLAPGGRLVLGQAETDPQPPGFVPVGPKGLNIFERGSGPLPKPKLPPLKPVVTRTEDLVRQHVDALRKLELRDRAGARAALESLRKKDPEYLPGLLELALLYRRDGHWREAASLMNDLLRRAVRRPADEAVAGPEALTVGYYRASAEAFLLEEEKKKG
jgi:chemotaxis methyl-accepting protein methylase